MFSIIICSINETYLEALKKNITETIGHPYELLVWDNLKTPKPITAVYNILGGQARFPYLCFIHEDILFQTKNWSLHLADAFDRHAGTGMIGVAGSKYKSKTPSGWSTGINGWDCVNIFHRDKNQQTCHLFSNPGGGVLEPVVNVDGVFIAIRKEVWNHNRFNDQMLRGFHLYDIDFSFQVTKQFNAMVIFSIDILHLTEGGNFGNEWVEYTLRWHREYNGSLPCAVAGVNPSKVTERKIRKNWLFRLSTEKISWKNKISWLVAGGALWDLSAWPYIGLFLFKKYFRTGK